MRLSYVTSHALRYFLAVLPSAMQRLEELLGMERS
jgi:hypothetical protein